MKSMRPLEALLLILLLAMAATTAKAPPLGTEFTYQGLLTANGSPANGNYDLKFTLFQPGSPTPGPSNSVSNVPVALGAFTVKLDFGTGVFDGTAYELEIGVRTNTSGGPFTTLQPHQPLTATPNATHARTVSSVPDAALSTNVPLLNGSPTFTTAVTVTMLRVSDGTGGGLLKFGPTDDCTVGVNSGGPTGLLLRDPRGVRVLSPSPTFPPTLRFGPTDDCSIGIDPAFPGMLVRDPGGLRLLPTGINTWPRLLFGPTDDCSIGIDPAFPGLIERDPIGFRLLGTNNQGGRLIFGPTTNSTIELQSGSNALTGLVLRDPIGFRLLGTNNQGGRLAFGPTTNCTIEVQSGSNAVSGLVLRDPSGVRILNPANATNRIAFGPTDDCRITADPNAGMRFFDPRGFTFGSQVAVNGPVFAQAFVQTSSRRFKNEVKPIEQPLEKISRLQGVRFTWNEEKGGSKDLGFIAEDVAKVIPEVVSWEADGQNARGVNYDHLVAVAIEGIKAQQTQIKTLEREKAELKASVDSLQTKLDGLSQKLEALAAR